MGGSSLFVRDTTTPLGTAAWLGRLPTGEKVSHRDDTHVLVAAGNRAGKGASFIIPNLCLWPGSVLVADPKGESAILAARRRCNGSPYAEGMDQWTGTRRAARTSTRIFRCVVSWSATAAGRR